MGVLRRRHISTGSLRCAPRAARRMHVANFARPIARRPRSADTSIVSPRRRRVAPPIGSGCVCGSGRCASAHEGPTDERASGHVLLSNGPKASSGQRASTFDHQRVCTLRASSGVPDAIPNCSKSSQMVAAAVRKKTNQAAPWVVPTTAAYVRRWWAGVGRPREPRRRCCRRGALVFWSTHGLFAGGHLCLGICISAEDALMRCTGSARKTAVGYIARMPGSLELGGSHQKLAKQTLGSEASHVADG